MLYNLNYTIKILLIIFIFYIASCSDSDNQLINCEAPVDTVSIIDSLSVNGTTYYLVLRITGWHDKTEIIELYDQLPQFNQCATSHIEPLYGDSLEFNVAISHIYLNLKNKSLDIQYGSEKPGPLDNQALTLELAK